MSNDESNTELADEQSVTWSSRQAIRKEERRDQIERRDMESRPITVPDMRSGMERRTGADRRKVRLTITGRAVDA